MLRNSQWFVTKNDKMKKTKFKILLASELTFLQLFRNFHILAHVRRPYTTATTVYQALEAFLAMLTRGFFRWFQRYHVTVRQCSMSKRHQLYRCVVS